MNKEEYNTRMEDYADKRYWEESDLWHDTTLSENP